ncbi:Undecaprenyl phosphate N,N'-diacetylbacillosamine 1-phosphate transferase [Oceanobacillus picturae]|uniref:Undecaprenyl phosphate N,N'-diacetylbacillosamine 1-phosphate transferase n=1 Tax=Oceanobacillus picturae TaxID=171693 RepID=W9AD79_9BACI|nr:sugar transferase [Oceanobacillus picturae]CDO03679.1 Undecaprenyl phosphate N,N'-diacetylbacillosamine 1-phosphate transferase [Oceanobacillus picturae]
MKGKKIQRFIKRTIDIVVSLIVIVPFLPIWIIVAILIKATSKGPVLFLQDRPGLHKQIFKVYKFRTMRPGSEKMIKGQEVMQNDARITSIGKLLRRTKVDEIPQLINVLKGEMSLVGPRPERIASLSDYDEEILKRLNVRPGMTGLAQVSGNIYLALDNRYKLDVYYVENFSLWLDLKIFLRTIGVVLLGEDKYVDNNLVDINYRTEEVAAIREDSFK